MSDGGPVTTRRIFRTFLPLALMWLMMSVEITLIAALVARLPNPKANLAAYGVAFSIGILIQSPVIMLLTAATALGGDATGFRRLMRYSHLMIAVLTLFHLIVAITPLYVVIAQRVMGVPLDLANQGRIPFLVMSLWPATVGYRRLYQGVLIRHGRAGIIPVTMLTRLAAVVFAGAAALAFPFLPGATLAVLVAALALTVGVLVSWAYARPILRKLPADSSSPIRSGRGLNRFYFPLALTAVMALAVRPILTAGLAYAPFPVESLAVFPVVTAFMFLYQSIGLSYQEVVVALLGTPDSRARLGRFAVLSGVALTLLYGVFLIPRIGSLWFRVAAGLQPDLITLTGAPVVALLPISILAVLLSYYRGILVHQRRTVEISVGVGIHAATVAIATVVGVSLIKGPGVATASLAWTVAFAVEVGFLALRCRR